MILVTLFIFSILFSYDGNSIKIVSSKKAQKEIDDKISDEVNKQVAVINRKKKRAGAKKILEATQIIDVSKLNKEPVKTKKKKVLEATQIIDISEVNKKAG